MNDRVTEMARIAPHCSAAQDAAEPVARGGLVIAPNSGLEAFAHSFAHELRGPLRAIGGFAGILREQLRANDTNQVETSLKRIEDNVKRMSALIERMLDLPRVGRIQLNPQEIDSVALVFEVLAELQSELLGRHVEFAVEIDCHCWGDPMLLRQVFANLIGNAVKYTRKREAARVGISARRERDEILFTVRDNGVGFREKDAGKLFAMFQRLHAASEFEGTGVGLAIVRSIVERHGGRIWAEGRLNEGAAFHFTLPAGGAV